MAQFTEFTDEAYHALTEDKIFEAISGGDWIGEDAWEAIDNDNPSQFIGDLMSNCDDAEIFKDYGLSCIVEHEQALKLAQAIMKFGF